MMLRSVLLSKPSTKNGKSFSQPFSNRFHTIAKTINKTTKPTSILQFSQTHKLSLPKFRQYNSEAQQQLETEQEEEEKKSKFQKITFQDWTPKLQKADEFEEQAKEFIRKQNYEEAESLIYSILFIRKSHIDSGNGKLADIAKDYLLLAYAQQNLRKNAIAEINYRLGIKLLEDKHKQEKLAVPERWNVLLQRMNYANLLASRNNFHDAIRQVKRVLTIIEKEGLKSPEYNEKYATILNNLAAYTSATGDATEARNLTEIALDLIENSVGVNNLLYEGTFETYVQILTELELSEEEIQEKYDQFEAKKALKLENVNGQLLKDIKPSKELLSSVERTWKRDLNLYPCDPEGFISPPSILQAQIEQFDASANPTLFNTICEDENDSITKLLSNVRPVLNRKKVVDPIQRYSSLINSVPDEDVDTTPVDKYLRILGESKYPELVGVERFNEKEQDFPNLSILKETSAVQDNIDTTHLKNAEIDLTGESNETVEEGNEEEEDEDDLSNFKLEDLKEDRETLEYALRNFGLNPKAFDNENDLMKMILRISESEENKDFSPSSPAKDKTPIPDGDEEVEESSNTMPNYKLFNIPETDEEIRKSKLFKFDPEDLEGEDIEELGEEYDEYLEGFNDPNVNVTAQLEKIKQFVDKEENPEDSDDTRANNRRIKSKLREFLEDPVIKTFDGVKDVDIENLNINEDDDDMQQKFQELIDQVDFDNQRTQFAKRGLDFDPEVHQKDLADALLDVHDTVRQIREMESLLDRNPSLLGDQKSLDDPIINLENEFEDFNPFTDDVMQEQREEKFLTELYKIKPADDDVLTLSNLNELDTEVEEFDQEAIITKLVSTGFIASKDVTPEYYKPVSQSNLTPEVASQFKEYVDRFEELAPFGDPKVMRMVEKTYKKLVDHSDELHSAPRRRYGFEEDEEELRPEHDVVNQEMKKSEDDELPGYVPRDIEALIDKKIASDIIVNPELGEYLADDFFKKNN